MSDPITLKSGAQLTINVADFDDSNDLMQVVARELAVVKFDLDLSEIDLAAIKPEDINTLKNVVFQLLQSKAVKAGIDKCMSKCLYNGQRITPTSFKDVNARQDYLPIAWEVIKANVLPFFGSLDFALSTVAKSTPDTPPSP